MISKPFDTKEFMDFAISSQVLSISENPITLKSGKKTNYYINWRTVCEDVYLINKLTDYLLQFSVEKAISFDSFFGVPEGATKPAIIAQFKYAQLHSSYGSGTHALPMGRADPKEHGKVKDRMYLGAPKGKVVVLEDVTTTGDSLLRVVNNLLTSKNRVIAAFTLTDRSKNMYNSSEAAYALEFVGVPLYSLSTGNNLIRHALESSNFSKLEKNIIMTELQNSKNQSMSRRYPELN